MENKPIRPRLTSTYTYVTLEVSKAAYDEIAKKLKDAGYDHAFNEGAIDMHGLALVRDDSKEFDDWHEFDK